WDYDPASSLVYWQPNQTIFARTDATASIFFLDANLTGDLEPTLDPIFHTNPQDEGDTLDGLSIPVYRPTRLPNHHPRLHRRIRDLQPSRHPTTPLILPIMPPHHPQPPKPRHHHLRRPPPLP